MNATYGGSKMTTPTSAIAASIIATCLSAALGDCERSGQHQRPTAHNVTKHAFRRTQAGYPPSAERPHKTPASTAGLSRRDASATSRRHTIDGSQEIVYSVEVCSACPVQNPEKAKPSAITHAPQAGAPRCRPSRMTPTPPHHQIVSQYTRKPTSVPPVKKPRMTANGEKDPTCGSA